MVLYKHPTRILFAAHDDRSSLRTKHILDALGYEVTVRTSSAGTLNAFREQPQSWDLAILDHLVSNMTGFELEDEIHRIRPEIVTLVLPPYGETTDGRATGFAQVTAPKSKGRSR